MGEMLRSALFGMTGWWVALICFGAWLWLCLTRDHRLVNETIQHDAAVSFASDFIDADQALEFLRLLSNGEFEVVRKRFPTWPQFLDAYFDEVDR